jgi:hypothetical protein
MPEQSGVLKPSDLLIGVIDFFAILVPGVLAAFFIAAAWQKIPEKPETLFFVEIVVGGFILGQVLHGIGSFLDPLLYDHLFKPRSLTANERSDRFPKWKYFRANDELFRLAIAETKHGSAEVRSPPGGMYQWARVWLRLHSPEATAELDRLEADSKFFRSLSVLAFAVVICWNEFPHWAGELPLAVSAIVFSLWRYCDLRQKMVRGCYLHYIQLRSERTEQRFKAQAGG